MKLVARLLIAVALLTAGSFAVAAPGPADQGRHGHDRSNDRHHENRRHDDRRYDQRRYESRRHDSRHDYRYDDRRYVNSPRYRYSSPRYYGHPSRWERGHRYYGPTYVVRDYGYYHLRHPPRGYHWVRANNDYLLVAIATGIILDFALR